MSKKQKTLFQAWSQTAAKKTIPNDKYAKNQIYANANATTIIQDVTNNDSLHKSDYVEFVPGFDMEAGKTWIFPANLPIRDYQFSIVKECLFKNTMVVLPTGLGKTFIAAVVMYNLYRWYPEGKVVFMAPTRPLVAQQRDACFQITGISPNDTIQMTGTNAPAERKLAWMNKRVFFLTPQTMANDLARDICPSEKIKCLVVDEAHKAMGNHAYCEVIRLLLPNSSQFRVLALTATPGSDTQAVKQVIANLLISHVELRTEESEDIQPYTHARNIEKIVVPLGDELFSLKNNFLDIINVYIKRLVQRKAFSPKNPAMLSKFQIIKLRELFSKCPPQGIDKRTFGLIIADFALCISLYHAYELLLHHGIKPFYQFLMGVLDGEKSIPHARSELQKNLDFEKMMAFVKENYFPENNAIHKNALNAGQSDFNSQRVNETRDFIAGHPKLKKLEKIVLDHFQSQKTDAAKTRVIIFSQYRDSVKEIEEMLTRHDPMIKVMSFLGQTSKTGSGKGVSQKQQLKVVEDFRAGGYNTLVATCVGEEGLDIGEVDLIVCYDCPKSPIRLVQRMGRTGRKRQGCIVMLVTEGKEEHMYNSSERQKKSIFRAIKTGFSFAEFYQNSPRMVPRGLHPMCVKTVMTIEPKITAKVKSNSKSEKKLCGALSDQEKLYFDLNFKIQELLVPILPTTIFLTLSTKENIVEKKNTSRKELSLNNWLPWQSMLHKTHMISHSSKTSILVDMLQFINHPGTLPKYNPNIQKSFCVQPTIVNKLNTLSPFLTGMKSKPDRCITINSPKAGQINSNVKLHSTGEDEFDDDIMIIESLPEMSKQQSEDDFLTFMTSMITKSQLTENASNRETIMPSLLRDFSFLIDADYLETSFEIISEFSCNESPTGLSQTFTSKEANLKQELNSCEAQNRKPSEECFNNPLNTQLSNIENINETNVTAVSTKEMFQHSDIRGPVQNTLTTCDDFAIQIPSISFLKDELADLSKNNNQVSNCFSKNKRDLNMQNPSELQPPYPVVGAKDKLSNKIFENFQQRNTSHFAYSISCKKNMPDDEIFESASLFDNETVISEMPNLQSMGSSNFDVTTPNVRNNPNCNTSDKKQESAFKFTKSSMEVHVETMENNVLATERTSVEGKIQVQVTGLYQVKNNKTNVGDLAALNRTTQCSLTQLASLVDSTPKVMHSLLKDENTGMSTFCNGPIQSDSEEEEICPTPPKVSVGDRILFSYKSSQFKSSPPYSNTFETINNSLGECMNYIKNKNHIEPLEVSSFSTENKSSKKLVESINKSTGCDSLENEVQPKSLNTVNFENFDTSFVSKPVHGLNTSFDLSFDVADAPATQKASFSERTVHEAITTFDLSFEVPSQDLPDVKTQKASVDKKTAHESITAFDLSFEVPAQHFPDIKTQKPSFGEKAAQEAITTLDSSVDVPRMKTQRASLGQMTVHELKPNFDLSFDVAVEDVSIVNSQKTIHELDTAFDFSFDVDFTQENLTVPVMSPPKPTGHYVLVKPLKKPTLIVSPIRPETKCSMEAFKNDLSLKQRSLSETHLKQTKDLKRKSIRSSDNRMEQCDNDSEPTISETCRNNLSLKQKSRSEGHLRETKSLKRKSICLSDSRNKLYEDDDNDFKRPKRSNKIEDVAKNPFKVPRIPSNVRSNQFIIDEAEVTDDDRSSDESDSSDLDQLDESFIDDNTICESETQGLGLYLESVKNYRGPQAQYKLKFDHPVADVFSQPVNDNDMDYMLDSFCVDNDDVAFLSSSDNGSPVKQIRKRKRKRIVLADSNSSSDDKTPLKREKREENSPFHNKFSKSDNPAHQANVNFKMNNNCSSNIVNVTKINGNVKTPPLIDLASSPEKEPNNYSKTDSSIQANDNKISFEDHANISFNVSWDDPLGEASDPTLNLGNKFTEKCKNAVTFDRSVIEVSRNSVSTSTNRPNNFLSRNQTISINNTLSCDSNTSFNNALSHESNASLDNCLDNATSNVKLPESGKSNFDLNNCVMNSSNPVHNSKSNKPASNIVILVSTRELASSKMICNFLRTNHGAKIVVMQLPDTDYIVSNRMTILRIHDSDFLTVQCAAKIIKKIKATKELYEKCCVIIEKDVRKALFSFNKELKSHLEFSLTIIQHSSIKILHSESQTESAKLLYELADGEHKRNMHIDVPVNLKGDQQQLYNFYSSLPHISPICALNFTYRFSSLQKFFQSSEEELKRAGFISSSKAHSIHWYLRANLKI